MHLGIDYATRGCAHLGVALAYQSSLAGSGRLVRGLPASLPEQSIIGYRPAAIRPAARRSRARPSPEAPPPPEEPQTQ